MTTRAHHLLLRLLDLDGDGDSFFPFPSAAASPCSFAAASSILTTTTHHRHLLHDPFFPPSSSCPLGFGASSHEPLDDLDLFLPNPSPPFPFLLDVLGDRVAAPRRKYSYKAEAGGRKVKWTAGEGSVKWEAEVESPYEDGFDRKWKWEAKGLRGGGRKVKWGKEVKGKGWLEPWSHAYTVEEAFGGDDEEEGVEEQEEQEKKVEKKKKLPKLKKGKEETKEKKNKCPVKIVEIEDNTAGCVAIRKAFAMYHDKENRKELSAQDAALLIQMNYRAHLARRSQVLRCLRDLAIAKAKLKEIRSLFYNVSCRRRIVHDAEERRRFSEKIIVLLLTVEALEGPDFMVRTTKKSMLGELEGMLEIVDPQPPGKLRSLSCRKFDLPEGGLIPNEMK